MSVAVRWMDRVTTQAQGLGLRLARKAYTAAIAFALPLALLFSLACWAGIITFFRSIL